MRPKGPQFAKLDFEFIDTAIRPLNSGETRLYLFFLRRYNGYNNGVISLSVREAAAICKCGLATAQRYLQGLQTHGLIEPVIKGDFRYKVGEQKNLATTWRLPLVEAVT